MEERCEKCKSKLNIINYMCKCEKRYCKKCRLPEKHSCEFNYRDKTELNKKLLKVIPSKIQGL